MTDKIVVLVTCSSAKEARKIARGLVERRLVACANILRVARGVDLPVEGKHSVRQGVPAGPEDGPKNVCGPAEGDPAFA